MSSDAGHYAMHATHMHESKRVDSIDCWPIFLRVVWARYTTVVVCVVGHLFALSVSNNLCCWPPSVQCTPLREMLTPRDGCTDETDRFAPSGTPRACRLTGPSKIWVMQDRCRRRGQGFPSGCVVTQLDILCKSLGRSRGLAFSGEGGGQVTCLSVCTGWMAPQGLLCGVSTDQRGPS